MKLPLGTALFASLILVGRMSDASAAQVMSSSDEVIDNEFLTMKVAPGWTQEKSTVPVIVLARDSYRLVVNPVFSHASPVEGGRFYEITQGMTSVNTVMAEVDQPASGAECTSSSRSSLFISKKISLGNLYTDSSKAGSGCVFPKSRKSVWFGSFSTGSNRESEYIITLFYETNDVNQLPAKGDPDLERTFAQVRDVLSTVRFKAPVFISRIEPASAAPGDRVTVFGRGFRLLAAKAHVRIQEITDETIGDPTVNAEGTSLTFEVPVSTNTVSCQEGRIEIEGKCLPIPLGHVDVDDCPRNDGRLATFCGKPIRSGIYSLSVISALESNVRPFSVVAPKSTSVSILLIYPNYMVRGGDLITVRGDGFDAKSNVVHIGSASLSSVPSQDGKNLTFRAPEPQGASLASGANVDKAWISNSRGESNQIVFSYR